MKVGFVGIGQMGIGMALNLLRDGHELHFHARSESETVKEALAAGARQAPSLADLARSTDVIVLCLTDTPAVHQVLEALPHAPALAGEEQGLGVDVPQGRAPVDDALLGPDLLLRRDVQ